jgi:hypothetical protein
VKLALLQAVPNDGDLATAFSEIGRSLDANVLSAAGSGPALLIVGLPAPSDDPADALATLAADYRPTQG